MKKIGVLFLIVMSLQVFGEQYRTLKEANANITLSEIGSSNGKIERAIKKGYEYAIANPEEAAKILVKNAPELKLELVIKSQKWLASKYKADVAEWGVIDQNRWDLFYEWLFKNGLIKKEIPKGYGFSNDYLK